MKKFCIFTLLFGFLQAGAATHIIEVSNNQFSPANLNVVVGDIVRWEWIVGPHNTASLNVPPGAATWTSPLFSETVPVFSYTVTIAGVYNYYCEVHGSFMSGSFTASSIVPVTLSVFNVTNKSNSPFLSWTTQQESNSDYFAVRRSYDGTIFTEIARVPAAVQSTVAKNYFFTDINVKPNVKFVYYELAITDKDGKKQLTPIKLFRNNEKSKKLITSLSPNPIAEAGHLLIQFNADASGKMTAIVNEINGRQVLRYELSAITGVNNGHIHLGNLPGGNYVVQFSLNGVKETYKVRKR